MVKIIKDWLSLRLHFLSIFILNLMIKVYTGTVYSIIYINGDTSMKRYNIKGVEGGGDLESGWLC